MLREPAHRAAVAEACLFASTQTFAQGRPNADPDWPCHQVKTPSFSLAAIWAGPDIDLNSQAWRNDPAVADLAATMSQRRVPIEDVEKAISGLKAPKPARTPMLSSCRRSARRFRISPQQRSQILERTRPIWPEAARARGPDPRGE